MSSLESPNPSGQDQFTPGGISELVSVEQLSRRELNARTNVVLLDYAEQSLSLLRPMIRSGQGKQPLGEVRFRPGEEQLLIDVAGESILASVVREHRLPAEIIGEHNTNTPLGREVEVLVDLPQDPIDNSSPYKRGLDILPYSVVGAFDHKTGAPIGGVIVDILGNKIYRSTPTKNTVKDVETGKIEELSVSKRTSMGDKDITIASFVSEKEYFLPFARNFGPMMEAFHRKGFLYPGGGAFIYALIASGAVDAYVMMNEPRSEIDPGVAFLLNGKGKAASVDPETGKKTPYKFDPSLTSSGSVPFFIAYAQEEIANQIIQLYLEGKKAADERDEALLFYRRSKQMTEGTAYDVPRIGEPTDLS